MAKSAKVRIPTLSELEETWRSLDGLAEQTITNTAKVNEKEMQRKHLTIVAVCMSRCSICSSSY